VEKSVKDKKERNSELNRKSILFGRFKANLNVKLRNDCHLPICTMIIHMLGNGVRGCTQVIGSDLYLMIYKNK
jgi:hypothetical protein